MHVRRQSPDPVFVDRTGRRRRLFAATGAAGGVLLAIASLALVAGFTGAGDASLPALPEQTAGKTHAVSTATPSATTRSTGSTPTRTARTEERGSTSPVTTPQASATPSPTHTNNRRVNTNRPSKKP